MKSIVITAYPSTELAAEAMKLGAIDYLIKPVAPDDLERLIRETLGSLSREPSVAAKVKIRPEPHGVEAVEVKKTLVMSKESLRTIVESLAKEMEVVGVKSKYGKYIYDRISSFEELCLDYDVTVMPPTTYLLPAKETLLRFQAGGEWKAEPVIQAVRRAIVGVRPLRY